ncbi:hypothetical protein EGT50_11660 [Rhodococcus xishaensis]|uniref:Uncharacterized protein n=1 Tax=Rhodococcus xishaensis TaxID=2487364 RepID=A0A3S3AJI1_9NOCA|nr:hypothetical protein EGT50_11660 [Rhodococcus xishaensis]
MIRLKRAAGSRRGGPSPVLRQGGRSNRRTLSSIGLTFGEVEVDRGMWQGVPTLVRPLVIGRAEYGNQAVGV